MAQHFGFRRSVTAGVAIVVLAAAAITFVLLTGGAESAPALPKLGKAAGDLGEAKALATPLSRFGFDLLLAEAKAQDDNVVISPASVHAALAMLLNGARGETAAELRRALQIEGMDQDAINQGWADLITAAQVGEKSQLAIANSLWLRNGVDFEQQFTDLNGDYYAAVLAPLKDDPEAAAAAINEWIDEHTHGKITKLFDSIDPLTLLTIVNTVYLKVGWEHFDVQNTAPAPFTLAGGEQVQAQTMHAHLEADVVLEQDYQAVRLPTDGPVDAWVIVPIGEQTPETVTTTLRDGGLEALYAAAAQLSGDVALPRLSLKYTAKGLIGALKEMGMRRAFDPELAELEGIADIKPLYVQGIRHKATLDLNEEGVEAAGATGVEVGTTSAPSETFSIIADRPFLVVLAESKSHTPLFMSIVRDPR